MIFSRATFQEKSAVPSAGTTSVTITVPVAGLASLDLLLALIYSEGDLSSNPTSAGWTQVYTNHSGPGGNGNRLTVLYRYAGASEPANYVFSDAAATFMSGMMYRYRGGVTAGTPFNVIGPGDSSNSSGSIVAPSISPDVGTLLFMCSYFASANYTVAPGGMSDRDRSSNQGLADLALTARGSTGTKTGTLGGADGWNAVLGVLMPAVSVLAAARRRRSRAEA